MAIGRPISLTPNIATKNISSLATADQTEFTVTGGYRINEIAVYRNGVRLAEGRDFTASDGDTVNLVTAASDADVIEFAVFDSFNVSDAIVSAASSQNLNGDFNVTGIFYAGDFKTDGVTVGVSTVSSVLHVGTALTAYAAGDIETIGIITAGSFSGDGSALTGLANTDFIVSVATTTGNLNVSAAATITGALTGSTGTFSGAVNVDATTDSTSSSTGALIVDGGLGVAKNVYIGAGLSVAGTLTYEDVTSVDSVGLITAKSGVNITGGQLTVGSGITMGIAGVATFSGTSDVHLLDNVRLNVGDGSDLAVYHAASANYITGTAELNLQSGTNISLKSTGGETMLLATPDGAVTLKYNNSTKFETTNDGTVTTGIVTATKLILNESGAFNDADEYLLVKNTDGACNLSIVANNTDHSSLNMGDEDDFNVGKIRYQHTDNAMCFFTSDAEKARISGVGSFGLGTATPKSLMEIVGANPILTIRDTETSQGSANARLRLAETGTADALDNYWDVAIDGQELKIIEGNLVTSTADTRLTIATDGSATFAASVSDSLGSLRDIPLRSVTGSAATLVVADAGKVVSTNTTGWTVPASTFSEGDTVTLLNNSAGGLTITCSAVTTYLTSDGTTVTSKTLGARGLATLYFVSASVAYLQGTSLS